jgi:hypothetical protein
LASKREILHPPGPVDVIDDAGLIEAALIAKIEEILIAKMAYFARNESS